MNCLRNIKGSFTEFVKLNDNLFLEIEIPRNSYRGAHYPKIEYAACCFFQVQ